MMTQAQRDRQMKKIFGDGPAERQILLMKLQHEFDTAPEFGAKFVADATFSINSALLAMFVFHLLEKDLDVCN